MEVGSSQPLLTMSPHTLAPSQGTHLNWMVTCMDEWAGIVPRGLLKTKLSRSSTCQEEEEEEGWARGRAHPHRQTVPQQTSL